MTSAPLLLRDWCGERTTFLDGKDYICHRRPEHDGPHTGFEAPGEFLGHLVEWDANEALVINYDDSQECGDWCPCCHPTEGVST